MEKLERDYGDPRALWRVYLYEFAAQTSRENRFGALFAEGLIAALRGEAPSVQNKKPVTRTGFCFGADYGARTRHLHLGKVALYQMS